MREIEIRRHCLTKKGGSRGAGSHLSAAGVAQARRIGRNRGPFDLVLTSLIPRTLETALAMGFAVDDQWEVLGDIPTEVWDEIGHQERWAWNNPFAVFAQIAAADGPTALMGRRQQEAWTQALESVHLEGKVLVISHGRVIEAGLVTCAPGADFGTWGSPFQHGEGIRMHYDQGRFTDVQFQRLP